MQPDRLGTEWLECLQNWAQWKKGSPFKSEMRNNFFNQRLNPNKASGT